MKETLRHKEAFEYYYGLGRERGLRKVAEQFHVSDRAVKDWSKAFNWQERVEQRDIENAKKIQQKTDETVINVKAGYRKIIKAAIGKLIVKDKDGKAILSPDFEVKSPHDLETLIKLDLLLMGEDTEIHEVRQRVAVYIPDNGRDIVSKP